MALNLVTLLSVLLASALGLSTRGCSPGNRPGKAAIEGTATIAAAAIPLANVTGTLEFEDVSMTVNPGGTTGVSVTAIKPVRFAKVVAMDDRDNPSIISEVSFTDAGGKFALQVPVTSAFRLALIATTEGSGHGAVDVRTPQGALYTFQFVDPGTGTGFSVPAGAARLALPATVLRAVSAERAAGIANILDVGLTCADFVRANAASLPRISFLYASTLTDGSFFESANAVVRGPAITIRGGDATQDDTDEFDDAVIAHEFGHFAAFELSRDSSLGGAHFLSAISNPPLAYSEGLANFFAGLVLATPVLPDTAGILGSAAVPRPLSFVINLDRRAGTTPARDTRGITSELTVGEVLWDLFDGTEGRPDADADGVALTTAQFFQIFRAIRLQPLYTSLLSFLDTAVGLGVITVARVQTLMIAPDDQKIRFRTTVNPDVFPTVITPPASITGTVTTSAISDVESSTADETNRFFQLDLASRAQVTLALALTAVDGRNASGTNVDLAVLTADNLAAIDIANVPLAALGASREVNPELIPPAGDAPIVAPGRYILYVHGRSDIAGGPRNLLAKPVAFTLTVNAILNP